MHLTIGLHRAVQQKPNAIATVFGERRRTFAELGERVSRLASALQTLGLDTGGRVAMLALNSDRYLEYYLAVLWAGGVVNPVNIRWSPAEIAYSLDDCDTAILLVDDAFAAMVPELRSRSTALRAVVHAGEDATPDGMLSYEALLAVAAPVPDAMRSGEDLAGILYTGGTTGVPKGVMLSHRNLFSNALDMLAEGVIADDGVGLHAAPMFHVADVTLMLALLLRGGRHVFLPAFDPAAALSVIEKERVTDTLLVPTMIQMLVDHPAMKTHDASSLRLVQYGASPISEAVLNRAFDALPGAAFMQLYGMTEMSPVIAVLPPACHTPEERQSGKLRAAGRSTFFAEIRVVDADDVEVPRGTPGEVVARGAGVMQGYWNKPAETAAAIRDGWMHTGDGGYLDEDGFLFIVDRLKDMIVTGGENVYSVEVENAIAKHPAVAMCAVIGIPDEKWGETVHAAVVLKPGADVTGDDIKSHCKTLIAGYKCPRSIEFRDALPLSGAGKLLKYVLRDAYWKGAGRSVG